MDRRTEAIALSPMLMRLVTTASHTCAFTSLVPTLAITQKFCAVGCDTESTAVLWLVFSLMWVARDIHAISGKLSTNGTVRRRDDRSEIPLLPETTNSSHI